MQIYLEFAWHPKTRHNLVFFFKANLNVIYHFRKVVDFFLYQRVVISWSYSMSFSMAMKTDYATDEMVLKVL